MSESHFFRRRWKLVVNVVTLGALTLLIFATRNQLVDTLSQLRHANAWALLIMVPIQLLNYHAQTKLYQGLFAVVGNKLTYRQLYRASLELNFVNHVFPSGGVTGISYFSLRMRKGDELTGSKVTLIQIMKLGLVFLSFEVLLIFGLVALAVMGRVSNLTILVAAILSTLVVVGTAVFVYIVGSQRRINSFFTAVTRGLNRVIHVVRPKHPETINISSARRVFDDFHANYSTIQKSRLQLHAPFWYALLANITEVLAIYIVFVAFGHVINIGAVILAYAVANFAGFISVLPGGVGIYEAMMTAVLATAGVPAAVSLPVVVTYRILNTLIQLPPGYFLYQHALARSEKPPELDRAA
jgi:hypothetical protein